MYYILYGFLYVLSLLPWRILYLLSDMVYLVFYYLVGYRKAVVLSNLAIAFPEKTADERRAIAKQFYHNFIDTFIETIKLISISDEAFDKRLSGNFDLIHDLYATGQSVQLHSGHFFNWEYINWGFARNTSYKFLGVYAPIGSRAFNRMMLKLRSRFGTVLIPSYTFKNEFKQHAKTQYAMGLAADQSAFPHKSFWLHFFGKLTPFVNGPEKAANTYNTAVVFVHFYKLKRGYYHADFELVTTEPQNLKRGELTTMYVRYLEKCIRKKPDNYLWSHRRWKYTYTDEFKDNLLV